MRRTKELLPRESSRYLGLGQGQRKGHGGTGRGGVVVLGHSGVAGAYLKRGKEEIGRKGGYEEEWGGKLNKGMNRAR